jgi:hypothetical protein
MSSNIFYSTWMKADGAGERDTLRKQYVMHDSREVIHDNKPKSNNPFPSFFGMGGNQNNQY